MEHALYHPATGYYSRHSRPIGRGGDFFTNISVGPTFAALAALDFRDRWQSLGCPSPFTIVEQAAHDGTFASDFLSAIAPDHDFSDAIRYTIVEPFPAHAAEQRAKLAGDPRVAWASSPSHIPPWTGIAFSNELLDAFPVRLTRFSGGAWRELLVEQTPEGYRWVQGDPLPPPRPTPSIEGFTCEVRERDVPWLQEILSTLQAGWIIAVDYGLTSEAFAAPWRKDGTIRAYRDHRLQPDLLTDPGCQDLTAHVDWTTLSQSATALGATVETCIEQGRYLSPLAARYLSHHKPSPSTLRQLQTLLHPALLGSPFHWWIAKVSSSPSQP